PVTLFVLVLLVGGAAFAVDRYLVPLEVLVTWPSPARLAISTDPPGATLRLDGLPVGASSPVVVSVHRDLIEHVLEASHPGFKPARANLRYDKTVSLAARLVLEAAPPPPPPPRAAVVVPAPPPPPVAPARGRAKRR
ncbi:MAG: PEGA domain-containing protein, partial [Pseudomonadota bacterium]